MRNVRDSFLHFLADNLTGVPIHPVRRDMNDPKSDKLQGNALNVQFSNTSFGVAQSTQVVNLDILNDNELVVVQWTEQLWRLLSSSFYTPLLDYTDPLNPVSTGTNIMWDRNGVRFSPIWDDYYYRYLCPLSLHYKES